MGEGSSRRRGCIVGCAVTLALGCVASAIVPFVVTDAVVAAELAERGLACEPVSASPWWSLDGVTIAPTSCAVERGPIQRITVASPLAVTVAGGRPTRVAGARVGVDLRPAAPTRATPIGEAMLAALQLEDRVCALLVDAAASTGRDWPALELDDVDVSRGGAALIEASGVRVTAADGRVDLSIDAIGFGGLAAARVREVEAHVEPAAADAAGRLDLDVNLLVRRVQGSFAIAVTGSELDTPEPACRFTVE